MAAVTEQPRSEQEKEPAAPPEERESVTEHTARIGAAEVAYRAVASTTTLRNDEGDPRASIFSVAYTRTGVDDAAARPLTFVFNGGPGSSSTWLHLGLVGPRRIDMPDGPTVAPAPYRVIDNDASLLDVTDLVFIDPVSTGYSRPASGQEAKQFHGLREDLEWVGEFIRLHTSRAGRWASPKFLVGESYGTTRAAGLAHHLAERHGMYVAGVGLISAVLMFVTNRADPGNDLPYVLSLPTYAATAWYHKRMDVRFGDLRALTGWPRTRACRRPSWRRATCASPRPGSTRSCCARSGGPPAASTLASRASTRTPPARRPSTTRATRSSRPRTPPPSTRTCAASWGSSPTGCTRCSTGPACGRGTTATTATTTTWTWPRCCGPRCRGTGASGCCWRAATTTWPRRSPPRSGHWTTWASTPA